MIALISVLGMLMIDPMRGDLDELKNSRKNMVEAMLPSLASSIATLDANNVESEKERDNIWDHVFVMLEWKGMVDERMRWGESQMNSTRAEIEHIENVVNGLYPRIGVE